MESAAERAVLAPAHDGGECHIPQDTIARVIPGDLRLAGREVNRPAKTSIPALTGIRFCAALLVIRFHFWIPGSSWAALTPAWITGLTRIGSIGVGIFFTLSGYILMTVYADADFKRAAVRRDFWVARFARVYPAYMLSLVLTTPFVLGHRFAGTTPLLCYFLAGACLASMTRVPEPRTVQSWFKQKPPAPHLTPDGSLCTGAAHADGDSGYLHCEVCHRLI